MGMHFGLLAIEATVEDFKVALPEIWPDLEVTASADGFQDPGAIWAWMQENERFVSAADWSKENPSTQTCALCQDGRWALLLDPSYTLASDTAALKRISQRFGPTLSFVVETAGGCAFFWCHETGDLRRSIINADGPTEFAGEPMPEEQGIDLSHYYMDETEKLMAAFKLSQPHELPRLQSAVALALVDRKDHGDLVAPASSAASVEPAPQSDLPSGQPQPAPTRRRKPWWRFW